MLIRCLHRLLSHSGWFRTWFIIFLVFSSLRSVAFRCIQSRSSSKRILTHLAGLFRALTLLCSLICSFCWMAGTAWFFTCCVNKKITKRFCLIWVKFISFRAVLWLRRFWLWGCRAWTWGRIWLFRFLVGARLFGLRSWVSWPGVCTGTRFRWQCRRIQSQSGWCPWFKYEIIIRVIGLCFDFITLFGQFMLCLIFHKLTYVNAYLRTSGF